MYICPECENPALDSTARLELPNDSMVDEASAQTLKCSFCGACALAGNEESRRGAPDSESWNSWAFTVSPVTYEKIFKLMAKCPSPAAFDCDCAAHKLLSKTDAKGRWKKLSDFEHLAYFDLKSAD